MTNNVTAASIHPPSIISTAEVQRHLTGENKDLTESDNVCDDNRCSNTVTTMTTGGSSSITSSEMHEMQPGLWTSSNDESHENFSSVEQMRGLTLARQAVRNAIDKQTINAVTSPEEAALALIRERQQLRQTQQQEKISIPHPATNSYPSDESKRIAKHRGIITNIPSPTLVKEQQPEYKSIILSHHIDRNDYSNEGSVPFMRNCASVESPKNTMPKVATTAGSNDDDPSVKATPDTSRSSSPSVSIDDVNVDLENYNKTPHVMEESKHTKSHGEVDDNRVERRSDSKIADNTFTIEPTFSPSAEKVDIDEQHALTVIQSTDPHRHDNPNFTAAAGNGMYCSPDSSFDVTKPLSVTVSPLIVQKVAAYIDRVTSTSTSQPTGSLKANTTNSIPESSDVVNALDEMTLATSQSNDVNIDPKMMNYVTSSVRDYIDSMHTNKTKTYTFDSLADNHMEIEDRVQVATIKEVEPLEVDTIPYDLQVDSLIEYLSAKASTKHNNIGFGVDPPSTSDDEAIKNDPPITLTNSEVTRSAVIEPEVNPFKAFTSDVEHDNAASDPEVSKPVIMYDELGERRRKSLIEQDFSNPVENTTLICDTKAVPSSYPLHSETVVDTPKRKTTFVTIPNVTTVDTKDENQTKDTFEPDGLYPSRTTRDFVSSIQNLYYLLTGNDDATDIEIQQFGKLVQFSFLFVNSKLQITSYGTSQIMTRANDLHVSLHITDRYLDAIRSLGDQSQQIYNNLEDLHYMNQFLCDLNAYLEILMGSTLPTEADTDDPSLRVISNVPVDAFEVEVNDGFTNVEFRPLDDEEPWWEVVARLNGTVCQDSHSSQLIETANVDNKEPVLSSNVNASKLEATSAHDHDEGLVQNSVERDIAKFWIDREREIRQPEIMNLPHVGNLMVKKAHSYSGQDVTAQYRKSKRISRTKSCSSTSSNISQRSLRSIRRQWSCQQNMAKSMKDLPKLNAVSATSAFFDKDNKLRIFNSFSHVWRLSYAERIQHHEGYFDVDKYSLYATSAVQTHRHPLDCVAWESRSVKQRFMYEHSISFTRNWFGCLTEMIANPIVKEPVCRPNSMEMPMEADEWTEEWFLNRHRYCNDHHHEDEDENLTWNDERPECGTIRNVRLRIGEKITRVTPDLTSYVRRSRWRKKHFPPGTFPYV